MEKEISTFVRKVYDEFVAPDYSAEGNAFFYQWISAEQIAERQKEELSLFIARADSEITGMIEIRENKNITLLFVAKKYQGKGIARALFKVALEDCFRKDASLKKFYVHASPFSVQAYQRLGFKAIGKMKEEHGITYLPMEMKLKSV